MKKKALVNICILTITALLLGCGAKTADSVTKGSDASTETSLEEKKEDSSVVEEQNETGETNEEKEPVEELKDMWLFSPYYFTLYYYKGDELQRSIKIDDIDPEASFIGMYGNNVVYSIYESDYNTQTFGKGIYVKNLDSLAVNKIDSIVGNNIYGQVYDDVLAMIYSADGLYYESRYDLNTLLPIECDISLYPKQAGYRYVNYNNQDYVHADSPTYIAKENGGVMWRAEDDMISFWSDGNVSDLGTISSDYVPEGYRGKKLICSHYLDGYSRHKLLSVDFENGGKETVISENANIFYGINGNKAIFSERVSDGLGQLVIMIKAYDMASDTVSDLFEMEEHIGMDEYVSSAAISFVDGDCYYIYDDGHSSSWYRYSEKNGTNLAFSEPVKTYEYFDFGHLELLRKEIKCDKCDKNLGSFNYEYMVFDKDKVKAADVINEQILEKINNQLISFGDESDYILSDFDCEEHGQYYCVYEDEETVDRVFALGSKYVVMDCSGYVYAGGAHGMPTRENHMYDVNTGKEVEFMDIYKGSFEDIRNLIAEKTREDYLSYSDKEYSPYYSDSADDIYTQAYDTITETYIPVLWDKEGLKVSYPPYLMGPFASGFIEFVIGYDELGISFE